MARKEIKMRQMKNTIYTVHNSSSWDDMMYHGLDHGITKLKTLLYSKKLKNAHKIVFVF